LAGRAGSAGRTAPGFLLGHLRQGIDLLALPDLRASGIGTGSIRRTGNVLGSGVV
jgi:hypothetical protein